MIKECTMIEPLQCDENDSVVNVAKALREHVIRHIYVVNAKHYPVGVISITDVNNRVVAEGKNPNTLQAKDIMTKDIQVYQETDDEREVYKTCVRNKTATCPIVRGNKLVGVVTIHELLQRITTVE